MIEETDPIDRDIVCNFSAVRHASRHMTRFYDQCLAPLGVRSNQFSILRLLYKNDGVSVNALAQLIAMDRTTVGHAIKPLERDGLITIRVDPADRRSRLLNLMPDGRQLAEEGLPIWQAAQRTFEAQFGEVSAKAMRAAMSRVVATKLV